MRIIAVVGSKKSGKTTTTENLIREFTKRGYSVAAIKHISEPDFTIDTPGKDTWKFKKAGADMVISVAANEIATIEKTRLTRISLKKLLIKCKGKDIVFMEVFTKLESAEIDIPKIVIMISKKEAENALNVFKPILAFSGPYSTLKDLPGIPYADGLKTPNKLADIVEKFMLKK